MLKISLTEKSKELIKKMDALDGKTWLQIMQTAVNQISEYVINEVKDNLTGKVLKRGKGRLINSIGEDSKIDNAGSGKFVIRVGSNLIYARIHEYGGTIVPKQARALVFQIGGRWIFAKKVTIPERSYLRTAVLDNKENILKIYEYEIMRGLKAALA